MHERTKRLIQLTARILLICEALLLASCESTERPLPLVQQKQEPRRIPFGANGAVCIAAYSGLRMDVESLSRDTSGVTPSSRRVHAAVRFSWSSQTRDAWVLRDPVEVLRAIYWDTSGLKVIAVQEKVVAIPPLGGGPGDPREKTVDVTLRPPKDAHFVSLGLGRTLLSSRMPLSGQETDGPSEASHERAP